MYFYYMCILDNVLCYDFKLKILYKYILYDNFM